MSSGRERGRSTVREACGIGLVAVLVALLGGLSPAIALATGTSDPQPSATVEDVDAALADVDSTDEIGAEVDQGEANGPEAPAAQSVAGVATAAGTVGSASGLTLTVLRDGTAPWDDDDAPGNDSSETNGIVRTHDSVVYRWGYSVATAGEVALTHTLPEGMSWAQAESLAACKAPESSVSADGRTLTCIRAHSGTGASTYQVRAVVDYAANGQVLSSVLSSAGTADSAPAEVTVSAAPKLSMHTTYASAGYTKLDGVPGQMITMDIYPYQQIDR
ncbi:hypothetical protein [Cellulomonas sp. NPDC089187]|uniref:hypothetical protein n=1 Tax=Cellulomonas sp. NPDC089187 TaxID=3154970 RepID=UPI00342E5F17